jgi:hypothetical protein
MIKNGKVSELAMIRSFTGGAYEGGGKESSKADIPKELLNL